MLSDYVLALLRHDASDGDLQNLLKEQLEDFLAESESLGSQSSILFLIPSCFASETAAFVSKTMGALKSQSYLPISLRISGNAESSTSSRKRGAEDEGRRSPAKMHRAPEDGDESDRLPRGPFSRDGARLDGRRGRNNKPPCRDFHLRGFCPRGDECRYDHTIPQMPEQGLINPMMNMIGGQSGQQQKHQFPMHSIPNAQHPHFGTSFGLQGGFPMGMQGPPGGWAANGNGVPPQQQGMTGEPGGAGSGAEAGFDLGARLGPQPATEANFHDGGIAFRGGPRGGRGGVSGRGGARGTFEKRATSNTTLVIENVPVENLDLIKINEYFKKFGTITNIQIDVDSKKALVSYSQPGEAKAAHTSPEVIFNNRFVKVYFQKLDDAGIGASKTKEVPAAAPFKNNFIPGQTSNKFVRPDMATKAKEAQSAATAKLDALMAQQKEIMTKLTTPGTKPEEKKSLMGQFGVLEKDIKAATEEVRLSVGNANNTSSKDASPAPSSDTSSKWREQREVKQREQLDRELEALNSGGGAGSTTEELKAQLAKLQEEAALLGIDGESAAAGRGSFRGRARGGFRGTSSRGFSSYNARGRGGTARSTMSIDNRPTKVLVSEIPSTAKEKAKEHFKQFGELHGVEDKDDGTFIIHYKVRHNAERALRTGLTIPDVGEVKASWVVENAVRQGDNAADTVTELAGGAIDDEEDDGDRDDHFRR